MRRVRSGVSGLCLEHDNEVVNYGLSILRFTNDLIYKIASHLWLLLGDLLD